MRITELTQLQEFYTQNLQSIRNDVYYLPRILVTAQSGFGKSTFISKLVPRNMISIFSVIIGTIRTTACTAQYYFDPELGKNLLAFSASKKLFNEISDKIIEISMRELADMLVDDAKTNKNTEESIKNRLFSHIFVSNDSLFNFETLLEKNDVRNIKQALYDIFSSFNELNVVDAAKSLGRAGIKDATLKNKVEEICFDKYAENATIQELFSGILFFIGSVIDKKISDAFEGLNDHDNLKMSFDIEDAVSSVNAKEFLKKIFGVPGTEDKGLQFFLENVIIHLPTHDSDYRKAEPFVIIDTQGINHDGDSSRNIADNIISIINSNRINELMYLATFSSHEDVLKVVEDAFAKVKKPLNISLCLTKFDEYVTQETVKLGGHDDLDDEEFEELIQNSVIKPADKIISNIVKEINIVFKESKFVTFNQSIARLSFARNSYVKSSTVSDVYKIIGEILDRVKMESEIVAVKRKPGSSYENLIPYKIKKSSFNNVINYMITHSKFIKSLKDELGKNVYWSSVYCLKNAIRNGNGHKTYANVYENFTIFPTERLSKLILVHVDEIINSISLDLRNIENPPSNLESVIKENIKKELLADGIRIMGYNLSYVAMKSQFEAPCHYYRTWWKRLITDYIKNLSSREYWSEVLLEVLDNIITRKIQTSISVN